MMKKISLINKLQLNKKIISNLDIINGGGKDSTGTEIGFLSEQVVTKNSPGVTTGCVEVCRQVGTHGCLCTEQLATC